LLVLWKQELAPACSPTPTISLFMDNIGPSFLNRPFKHCPKKRLLPADETHRFEKEKRPNRVLPLRDWGITEADALQY